MSEKPGAKLTLMPLEYDLYVTTSLEYWNLVSDHFKTRVSQDEIITEIYAYDKLIAMFNSSNRVLKIITEVRNSYTLSALNLVLDYAGKGIKIKAIADEWWLENESI